MPSTHPLHFQAPLSLPGRERVRAGPGAPAACVPWVSLALWPMRWRPGPCLKPCLAGPGVQVGLLDIDICGPSVPKMLGLEGEEIHQSGAGWSPVYVQVGGADVPCVSNAHVAWSVHAMRAWSCVGSCELVARAASSGTSAPCPPGRRTLAS